MSITTDQRRLLALCAIRVDHESVDWSLIAREAQFPDGLDNLWSGSIQEKSAVSCSRARLADETRSYALRPAYLDFVSLR